MMLDEVDRRILNRLQEGFPITPQPFEAVAQELGHWWVRSTM
jgi:DNA-binding Lrp family transcriptional regulator